MPTVARFILTRVSLACALSAAFLATAAESPATGTSGPQSTAYPAIDPAFSRPEARRMPSRTTLRAFLTELKSQGQTNRFCFVQQGPDRPKTEEPGLSVLSMIWYEGQAIYLVNLVRVGERYDPDTALDPVTRGKSLASSTGTVDLTSHVVPTDEDVGTSTFLVSRPWVDHMFAQCRRVGTKVRIRPFQPRSPVQ
ncbi:MULTISPECIES: hypothetical protein [Pseudomonadota]|nr:MULTISPECIES: hypothetical protein [Pseudomonadota]